MIDRYDPVDAIFFSVESHRSSFRTEHQEDEQDAATAEQTIQ